MIDFNPNFRENALTDIVELNGNYYYIDSVDVPFSGCETMVFHCNENGNVSDWSELYCERYTDAIEMETRHKEIVANLGKILSTEGR